MMESILGMDTFLVELEIGEELIKDFDLIFSIHINGKKSMEDFLQYFERDSLKLYNFSPF
jgi:hypothetical protein